MSLSPQSQDWMVLQCGACGNRLKVRREVALESRLLCPSCQTPVPAGQEDLPGTAASSPEPPSANSAALPLRESPRGGLPLHEDPVFQGGVLPSGRPPMPPRLPEGRAAHPEFHGRFLESDAVEEEDVGDDNENLEATRLHPEQRRRVKIKKRSRQAPKALRYLELTDWDQKSLNGIPEAEIAADIWSGVRSIPEDVVPAPQESEYVVEAVDEGNGMTLIRKKKVSRRRLLQGARLLFQRFTWLSRFFTVALAVCLAGVAVYGFHVLQQKYRAPVLPPVTEPPIDRSVLAQSEALAAEQAVRDFLAADGIEAKLALVRQPERIRPLMQKWYRGGRSAGPLQAGEVTMQDKKGGEPGSPRYYVLLAIPVFVPDPLNPGSTLEEMNFFAIEEIRQGAETTYLVDWETSTGYQEIPLETYKATMPPEPWPFRIRMKAGDYYNHGFNELEWQCVTLYYPGRDFHLYGYINRVSIEGRKLLDLIEGGNSAGIIAELVYPPDAASRDQVIVKKMLHSSWFYDTAKDAAQLGDAIPPDAPQ